MSSEIAVSRGRRGGLGEPACVEGFLQLGRQSLAGRVEEHLGELVRLVVAAGAQREPEQREDRQPGEGALEGVSVPAVPRLARELFGAAVVALPPCDPGEVRPGVGDGIFQVAVRGCGPGRLERALGEPSRRGNVAPPSVQRRQPGETGDPAERVARQLGLAERLGQLGLGLVEARGRQQAEAQGSTHPHHGEDVARLPSGREAGAVVLERLLSGDVAVVAE
jgi:hypothetical protein